MPPWLHLPVEDIAALVVAVRHLALEGKVALLMEDGSSEEEAKEIAHEILDSGDPVKLPEKPGKIDLALGKKIYMADCASCHDEDGRGKLKLDLKDEAGNPIFARDFTEGIFKGGADDKSLGLRLVRGLPGSAMPAKEYKPDELWAMVKYIQDMIKPGAQDRVKQRQETLVAKRVKATLDDDPENSVWNDVPASFLPLMPLWWRNDRTEGVEVKAVHDGSKVAIRLSWEDPNLDGQAIRVDQFSDAAAVQFSSDEDPPFMGMGDKENPVNIWYWKADHNQKGETLAGIDAVYPNMMVVYYPFQKKHENGQKKQENGSVLTGGTIANQDPTYVAGLGAGNPVSKVHPESPVANLHAGGFGTLSEAGDVRSRIAGKAVWKSGKWTLVMSRNFGGVDDRDVPFEPGKTVSVGFAVWEGSAKDRNGQKQVSIWHKLTLE